MPTELVDLFQLQLSQQAMLYDLTYMSGRRRSAERVSEFFLHMQSLLPVTTVLEIGAHEAAFSRAVKRSALKRPSAPLRPIRMCTPTSCLKESFARWA